MDDTGEPRGIANPSEADSSPAPAAAEDDGGAFGGTDSKSPPRTGEAGGPEPALDDTLPPAFRLNRAPRDRAAQKGPWSRWPVLFSLACLGAGALAGYLLARTGQKPVAAELPAGVQKSAGALTRADEDDLDAAFAARHAHRYDEAEALFAALAHRHPEWGPLEIERGRTLFYGNKSHDASVALNAAAEKGWKPAEANFLLGVLNKSRKSYPEAEWSFARAVEIDPTEPEYYFFWGECLREEGKLLDAAAKLRSALLRNQYETATGLYRAKLWLCAVEADQGGTDGVNAQIDAALGELRPPMEAYIAAAARDLKAGDFGAAAAHLSRARRRADATVFRYILSDPLFAPARSKPEFADFFESAPPATSQETNAAASSPAPPATGGGAASTPAAMPAVSPAKGRKP